MCMIEYKQQSAAKGVSAQGRTVGMTAKLHEACRSVYETANMFSGLLFFPSEMCLVRFNACNASCLLNQPLAADCKLAGTQYSEFVW